MKFIDADQINDVKQMYLVFGEPGTGKTSAIKNLQGKTIYVSIDGTEGVLKKEHPKGMKVVVLEREDVANIVSSFPILLTTIERKYLNDFDNVVFDNISYLQDLVMNQIKGNAKDGRMDWMRMQELIRSWVIQIRSWNTRIYMTAWEETVPVYDESGNQVTLYDIKLNAKLRSSIKGLFTVVGRSFVHDDQWLIQLAPDGRHLVKNQIDKRKFCRVDELFTDKEWLPDLKPNEDEKSIAPAETPNDDDHKVVDMKDKHETTKQKKAGNE